jgi:5'-3' exonuclease
MKYILIDTFNTYFRSIHGSKRGTDLEEKVAYALHVTMQSVASCQRNHGGDHVIFFLEGKSWRKSFYKPYKANRDVKRAAQTELEQKEGKAYFEGLTDLIAFLNDRTNVSVLQHPELEADDLIGGWIQNHPDDEHVIISTDTDFYQLLAENVTQYNGVSQELHTINGILDAKGRKVLDKTTKLPKTIPDPKFILFEKCMRGDPTDNIFSAYPGVRTKGSKNKVGLIEAYADKEKQGYAWNNLMLQRWAHHDGTDRRVLDEYNRNVILVDLTAQPADIRAKIDETVTNVPTKKIPQLGLYFLKFCGKHNLQKLSEQADYYVRWLSAEYKGKAV